LNSEQLGDVVAQLRVGEPVGLQSGDGDGGQQGVYAGVAESQRGDALSCDECGVGEGGEDVLTDGWVVVDVLGGEQAPVPGEPDLSEGGQVAQPFADPEVAAVIDRGLGPDCPALFVVLLEPG
jgi:hypothetical protein